MIKFITNRRIKDLHESILLSEEIEIGTLEELWNWRRGRSIIFSDTETNTLNYRSGDLLLRQFGDFQTQFVLDWTVDLDNRFYDDVTFVFHNAMFDYNQLKRHRVCIRRVYDTMIAMMVVTEGVYTDEQIQEEHPYRFEQLVLDATSHQLSKDVRVGFLDIFTNGTGKPLTAKHIIYSADDVKYLEPSYNYIHNKVIEDDLEDCVNLENRYVLAFSDMIYNGVKLDKEAWIALEARKKIERDEMQFTIDDALIVDLPQVATSLVNPTLNQMTMFETIRKRKLRTNYSSPKQVSAIFKMLGLEVTDKTGKETTGIKELKKLKTKSKFIESFINLKELEKSISSFGSNYLKFIDPITGRIHPQYAIQILNTGRTALQKPNLYQIPKDNSYRNCFIGEFKDGYKYFYVGGDYKAQEGRIMADKAKDAAYIDFFNNGDGDAHSFVASKMFSAQYGRDFVVTSKTLRVQVLEGEEPLEIARKFQKLSKLSSKKFYFRDGYVNINLIEKNVWRQNGKILNFFLSFGGSAFTLSMELGIPMEESSALIKAFFDGFPTLKAMFTIEANFALKNGYSVTNPVTKRRRYYPEWNDMKITSGWIEEQKQALGQNFWAQLKDKTSLLAKENRKAYKLKGDIERAGQNMPIQGTAADMSKTAMVLEREKLLDNNILPFDDAVIKIILMPHDEIQTEVREDYLELAKQILADAMDEAGQCFVESISLRPDIEVNEFWKK